jgi:protein tyrosine phosphatase
VLEEKLTYEEFVGARISAQPPHPVGEVANRLAELHRSVQLSIETGAHVQEYQALQTVKYNVRKSHEWVLGVIHLRQFDFSSSSRAENATANRYRNILANEATIVRLSDPAGYINANLAHIGIGDGHPLHVIMTQAPLPNTSQDFWQMVMEQGSRCIVMLTSEMESGRVKSHSYWPKQAGASMAFGHLVVTALDVQPGSGFQATLLRVLDTRTAKV